jgi:hypothetical protein
MKRVMLVLPFLAFKVWSQAPQNSSIQRYLGKDTSELFAKLNAQNPGGRDRASLEQLLPIRRPFAFPRYIMDSRLDRSAAATSLAEQASQIASLGQLNKMLGSPAGSSGTTSLLSSSVAADVLSIATEYGAITQTNSGNVTTLRTNLLGISGLVAGDPYLGCPSLAAGGCTPASRWLRGLSSYLSVETATGTSAATATGTNASTGATVTASIPKGNNRMGAWGARFDWFRETLYDSPRLARFASKWADAMTVVSESATEAELDSATSDLMQDLANDTWLKSSIDALQSAGAGALENALTQQLDSLISMMASKDVQFMAKVQRAQNAVIASFVQRDEILRSLQNNKFSTEFNSQHPLGQPNISNARIIYSYQPTKAQLLFTFNFAAEWYDHVPSGVKLDRLRDYQLAAQLDRRISQFRSVVFTGAFYYQWMHDNALIRIPAGNLAPGTGIVLPGSGSTLLATKGDIRIGQVKLTMPIKGGLVKIPVSFTWANRTELINESEKRGQIGLTLDLDSVFQGLH